MKYMISSTYYDGMGVEDSTLGLVEAKDLNAFVVHLKACGFVGGMRKNKGSFSVTLNQGWLAHHGNHVWDVNITPYKEPPTLTPQNWGKIIYPFEDHNYTKVEDGYFEYDD